MSAIFTGFAVVAVGAYYLPNLVRRELIRRKHKVFHYLEYELYGDKYSTQENGAINEFIADAVLWNIKANGGKVTYHYTRRSLDAVQAEIDRRYYQQNETH